MVDFYINQKNGYSELCEVIKTLGLKGECAGINKLRNVIFENYGLGDRWVNRSIQRLLDAKLIEKVTGNDGEEAVKWIGE